MELVFVETDVVADLSLMLALAYSRRLGAKWNQRLRSRRAGRAHPGGVVIAANAAHLHGAVELGTETLLHIFSSGMPVWMESEIM